MAVSAARAAAFDILQRVEKESSYAADLLHATSYQDLSTADHALATELVMGVLRWRSLLDAEIAKASSQPLPKLDQEILIALRLALYQMRYLDRVPTRAAIHESVELVKRARKRSAASFVNAVLRKLAAGASEAKQHSSIEEDFSSVKALVFSQAHPMWLLERWAKHYGLSTATRICEYDQSVPMSAIRLRDCAAEAQLREEGIELSPGALLATARRVQSGDIIKTRAFRSRQIVIQDEASQLVAALVGPAPLRNGSRILDCCAAPGGKTLAMFDRNPGAIITAVELHPHRARLLQKLMPTNAVHSGGRNIHVVVADSRHLPAGILFDRILADVPCSGTGTLARNPEIKWRLQPRDLIDLAERQQAILNSAMKHLALGCRLIYSTCSLEREENENVIEQALKNSNSFRVLDCRPELERLKTEGELIWPHLDSLTSGPFLRTLPGIQPSEGFFAAILEKV